MPERERLIQQLDEARATMQAVVDRVDPKMEIYPGWTMKHVLAHIAGWDDATIASLQAHMGGEEPGTPAVQGIDFYNAQSVATREPLSYEQIQREWAFAREQVKDLLRQMPAEKFAEPLLSAWGATGTIAQLIAVFVHHEIEHAEEIEGLLGRGGFRRNSAFARAAPREAVTPLPQTAPARSAAPSRSPA